jgi:Undecaprenyl-phosphate galactose phosphotransferase WbaP
LFGVPVIVLGSGETSASVTRQLQRRPDLGLLPVAILDDDMRTWGADIEGVPVCGPISFSENFCKEIQVAVIAMPELNRENLLRLVQRLAFPTIIIVPNLSGIETLWTMSRDLGGVLGIEVRKNLLLARNRLSKKVLDYAIAVPAFVLSLPCLAICALWIRIVSPGPVLFRHEREGKDGWPIKVWKLRTMHPDAEKLLRDYLTANPEQDEAWKRCYKLKNDPRIIRGIGWFLRVSSLDELPQLWNVLRGDMSLVGPRPFPFYHLESFSKAFRILRRSTSPGLTGLWQVSERSDGDLSAQEAQDTYYIRNWSLWLDIYILLRTIRTVVLPKGAY